MKNPRRYFGAVAVTLICASVLAVATLSAGAATVRPSIRGLSAKVIKIGGDATETIGGVPTDPDVGLGAQAYYHEVNASGGVDGRKIDYLGTLDDGGSISTLQGNLTRLVGEGAYAIAPLATDEQPDLTYINQNQLMGITSGLSPSECADKWILDFDGCIFPPATGKDAVGPTTSVGAGAEALDGHAPNPKTGAIAVKPGSTYSAVAPETTTAYGNANLFDVAKAMGFTGCYQTSTVPATGVTDWTPYATQVMQACGGGKGPTLGFFVLPNAEDDAAMIAAMRALGWKGVAEIAGYAPSDLQSAQLRSELDGAFTYSDGEALPGTNNNSPVFSEMRSALKAIGDGSFQIDSGFLQGWIFSALFVAMLRHAGPNNLAPAKVDALANDNWDAPGIPGLSVATAWPDDHYFPVPCYNVLKLVGNHFVQVEPFACGQVLNKATGKVVAEGFTPASSSKVKYLTPLRVLISGAA